MGKMKQIKLINDTLDSSDISSLIKWLETNPRLTKGELTIQFEKEWSKWLGKKYSVFVNSGSSANLGMVYALMQSNKLRNKKIILPAVSWTTTVTPAIHLGLEPILCECDKETLGLDIDTLKQLIEEHKPAALMLVHVLAFPCKMDEIIQLCEENDIILLEDSCESIGSEYNGIKTGNFGLMSTFSFYYGHHISTIEGGMISTDDKEIYDLLLSIRSHGWDRDYDAETQKAIREKNGIDDFKGLFSFYQPGFNLRSTDLQAFIGLNQIPKIDRFSNLRNKNFKLYNSLVENSYWKIKDYNNCFCSNFAYPIITPNLSELVKELKENNVECRPLVCGSIGLQPFWKNLYGEVSFNFADDVHNYGLYLPNNQDITEEEITFICKIVNKHTK
jgi:CDP-6-deoxy-D-xylo-4-hexulose-3-dehydrase